MEKLVLGHGECLRLINALDFYSRMWIGQYERIEEHFRLGRTEDFENFDETRVLRERKLLEMRNLVMPGIAQLGLSGSYGIWSPQTSDLAKSAYDMQQIIRHDLSWRLHPEGGSTVNFNAPMLRGSMPRISCELIGSTQEDVSVVVTLKEENRALMEQAVRVSVLLESDRLCEMMGEYTKNVQALKIAEELEGEYPRPEEDAFAGSTLLEDLHERLRSLIVETTSAFELDRLLDLAERSCGDAFANGKPGFCSPRVKVAIQELIELMAPIRETGCDGYREIWVEVPRGSFSDYRQAVEEEYRFDEEEPPPLSRIEQWWREEYPNESNWYRVGSSRYQDWLSVGINGPIRFLSAPKARQEDFLDSDRVATLLFLAEKVRSGVEALRLGSYNGDLRKRLPFKWRRGKIKRSKLWGVDEGYRERGLGDLSSEEVDRFCELAARQIGEGCSERLPEMTAQTFFECCEAGYRACGKDGIKWDGGQMVDAMEWYKRYGYDDSARICEIDPDSAGDFDAWYSKNQHRFDHTFQIAGYHGYSRVDLSPVKDERGWCFHLCHLNDFSLEEIVRFFLAISNLGYPVELDSPEAAVRMIRGEDWVGIVRHDRYPAYCWGDFPDEKMFGFINLPSGDLGVKISELAEWYPLEEAELSNVIGR
jgi:hypothetical protein